MEHFNKLTPAEAERLAILAEECGEVIQAVGKILRHGYASCHPADVDLRLDNRNTLEKEIGDIQSAIAMMREAGDISETNIAVSESKKRITVVRYMHHYEGEK